MGFDIDKAIGEIKTPDAAGRELAMHTLSGAMLNTASLQDIAKLAAMRQGCDVGLPDFPLDTKYSAVPVNLTPDLSPDGRGRDANAFVFTNNNDPKNQVFMFDNGAVLSNLDSKWKKEHDVGSPLVPGPAVEDSQIAGSDAASAQVVSGGSKDSAGAAGDNTVLSLPGADAAAADSASAGAANAADEALIEKYLRAKVNEAAKSFPVGHFYQVLERMHPAWTPQETSKEAHRINRIFNNNCLKAGERLPLMTADEKAAAVASELHNYHALSPGRKLRF